MEAPTPALQSKSQKSIKNQLESKEYQMSYQEGTYKLIITTFSEESIEFNIRQTNNITSKYYQKEYCYKDIINLLILVPKLYTNVTKILNYLDKAIKNNDLILKKQETKEGNSQLMLAVKRQVDYETIEAQILLEEKNIKMEDMITIMTEEVNKFKKSHIINTEKQQNVKEKKNEKKINSNEDRIKELEEKINKQEEEIMRTIGEKDKTIDEMKQQIEKLEQQLKLQEETIKNNHQYLKSLIEQIKKEEEVKKEA